ncbi:hypothetical protein PHYSODRAFT_555347 [Phytophthora sojae]|uniref:dolichyl-phosphate beta-glucosyltransferase n=1 Tax=Phytophthora sojae (strain P6497) TaxID=1094619 RepID=G4YWE6_PHYSP|nr:hypothetical protein PHYSODRAFT_555347 [Phytophthora sojae]EGZ25592.1 hypothetical protein PHYSODRAFT_555347 [Phytophthora sojae]|eukprot:XP_009520880.1 hypothetical protein PHYSODRAFT_555347 [Phytophthora sojae]
MVLTSAALNAALIVASVALATGAVLLLAWIRAPIAEAKKLAAELDPPQEGTRPFGSLGDEKAQVSLSVRYSVDRIRLLRLQKNHGKGGAIRKGVMRARGKRVLFADADNATEVRDYDKLAAAMDEALAQGSNGVVVCGSRAHLEEQAIAKRNPLRNLLMYGFHLIVSTLCIKNVRDTQCGFKLFDRKAARVLFAPMHIERWAFDVELLYLAASSNMAIKEVAVQWTEVPGSKLSVISATLTMLREIILIRLCYTVGIWKVNDGGFRLAKRP